MSSTEDLRARIERAKKAQEENKPLVIKEAVKLSLESHTDDFELSQAVVKNPSFTWTDYTGITDRMVKQYLSTKSERIDSTIASLLSKGLLRSPIIERPFQGGITPGANFYWLSWKEHEDPKDRIFWPLEVSRISEDQIHYIYQTVKGVWEPCFDTPERFRRHCILREKGVVQNLIGLGAKCSTKINPVEM